MPCPRRRASSSLVSARLRPCLCRGRASPVPPHTVEQGVQAVPCLGRRLGRLLLPDLEGPHRVASPYKPLFATQAGDLVLRPRMLNVHYSSFGSFGFPRSRTRR